MIRVQEYNRTYWTWKAVPSATITGSEPGELKFPNRARASSRVRNNRQQHFNRGADKLLRFKLMGIGDDPL